MASFGGIAVDRLTKNKAYSLCAPRKGGSALEGQCSAVSQNGQPSSNVKFYCSPSVFCYNCYLDFFEVSGKIR